MSCFYKNKRQRAAMEKARRNKNIAITCAASAAAIALPFILNAAASAIERRKNPPCGSFVEQNGKKMHIFCEGQGGKTLVFLGGTSISAPAIDFMPISARLRTSFRCVTPEPFGYGYSDNTRAPRTLQNTVSELRYGLLLAGLKPPYTLFAAGDGGVTALYWAARYPKEIDGVIGEDSWVSSCSCNSSKQSPLLTVLNKCGTVRMLIALGAGKHCIQAASAFDASRLNAVRAIAADTTLNAAHIDSGNRLKENYASASKLRYPQKCRLLMFLSQEKTESVGALGIDWVSEHEKQTVQSVSGECHLIRGAFPLHRNSADFMATKIREFMA